MAVFKLEKKRYFNFLNKIKKSYELIAPVKRDLVRYEKITNLKDIYLKKNSYFPVKEYFFKKQHVLFEFNKTKIKVPKENNSKKVFFGLRRCDLNAIKHQDLAFNEINDPYYAKARENSYLLGYHCNKVPSNYCFCGSMDLIDFFDLMFYERKNYFLVEVGSEKGKYLCNKFNNFFKKSNIKISESDKKIKNSDRLKRKDISWLYDNPDWKKGVNLCLSCGACTVLCPTCYCFNVFDEVSSKDIKKGERIREWSSCQMLEFTRVAGNFIFRKDRESRFKHRIYHQLDYFKKKNGVNLCVGCGRCIEGCPTRIDFVEIINNMEDEE